MERTRATFPGGQTTAAARRPFACPDPLIRTCRPLAARVVHERQTPAPVVVAIACESHMRGASMRERAEAQRKTMEVLSKQVADQFRIAKERHRGD